MAQRQQEIEWTLGERIRKARKMLGLEQDEFGALFGVTNKSVSQWETDVTVPKRTVEFARKVEELAKKKKVSVPAQWLLLGDTSRIPCYMERRRSSDTLAMVGSSILRLAV